MASINNIVLLCTTIQDLYCDWWSVSQLSAHNEPVFCVWLPQTTLFLLCTMIHYKTGIVNSAVLLAPSEPQYGV